MDLNPWERRQKILEVLCLRRHDTYGNLAHEFNVSTGTIRRDSGICWDWGIAGSLLFSFAIE